LPPLTLVSFWGNTMKLDKLTGRIDRRGNFTTDDGRKALAEFGRPWADRLTRGKPRARVQVAIDGASFAGIVLVNDRGPVTLQRQFGASN
jgi:hypothetical protein